MRNRNATYSPSLLVNWLLHNRGVFFDEDDNPAGGGNPGGGKDGGDPAKTTPEDDKSGGGKGNGDPSKTPDGKDDKTKSDPPKKAEFTPEQQAELNRLLAKERRDTEKRLKDAAEEEAAKSRGEFEKLHATLEKRVKEELEPKAALADELSEMLHTQIDGEIKDWNAAVKKAIPTREEANVKERIAAVERNRDLQKTLSENDKPPRTNHGENSDAKAYDPNTVITSKYARPGKR